VVNTDYQAKKQSTESGKVESGSKQIIRRAAIAGPPLYDDDMRPEETRE
jgi:hypothetical protein